MGESDQLGLLTVKELVCRGVPLEYHIVGDGPARTELMRWARELDIEGVVRWHGVLDPMKVRGVLERSHVVLHPSVSDSLPVAILEAMAMGLPVVATRVGGIPEAIVDGETGLLVPFGDVTALLHAVLRIWEDPELRRRMSEASRRKIKRDFSMDREVEQWVDLYGRLARRACKQL